MQPYKDIYVRWVIFRPHALCIVAEPLFACWRGVRGKQKHMEIETKIVIYSVLVPC